MRFTSKYKLRVSDQNGVSSLYIMLKIHHSGREPSKYDLNPQLSLENKLEEKENNSNNDDDDRNNKVPSHRL